MTSPPLGILVLGATGTIGRATVSALLARGHDVVCFVRPPRDGEAGRRGLPEGCEVRLGDPTHRMSVEEDGFRGEAFHAVVSCMASRTGVPSDAWAVDHRAHLHALEVAKARGVGHFVLLSAICVQKPRLAFQEAKLAFEEALRDSGLRWSIVRPTAYFKSVSGQVKRVKDGKPFLVFGDGSLTACKPIGDQDLAAYLADCLEDPSRWNRVLPVGGPGPARTPREQGELLFRLAGAEPRFRSVPAGMLRAVAAVLGVLGRVVPPLREKAALARIGHYYATESMLVWDEERGRYDADATPEYGSQTLEDHLRRRLQGEVGDQRGEHAVF